MGIINYFFRKDPAAEIKKEGKVDIYSAQKLDSIFSFLDSYIDNDQLVNRYGGQHRLSRLMTDDEISAAFETRQDACISTSWQISGGSEEVNQFMTEQIWTIERKLARFFWQAVPYGMSVTEIVYKKLEGNRIGIEKVIDKPLEWFAVYHDGTKSFSPAAGSEVKLESPKYIFTLRNPTFRKPMGDPLLAKLIWAHYFRCNGWNFWFKYIEKFANPFLFGQTQGSEEHLKAMLTELERARQSSSIVTDKDSNVTLLNAASKNSDFKDFDDKLVERIQKVVLGQTLTSQTNGIGSFAAAKVHNFVREDKKRSDCKMLEESFNQLIYNLFVLNKFSGEIPEFKLEDKDDLVMSRAQRDALLVNSKIVKLTDQYVRDRYDFNDGDFEIPLTDVTIPLDTPSNGAGTGLEFSTHDHGLVDLESKYKFAQTKFEDDELERLITEAMEGTSQPVNVSKVRDVVLASKNEKDLINKLSKVYVESDGKFEDNLTNALYAAKVLGYLG